MDPQTTLNAAKAKPRALQRTGRDRWESHQEAIERTWDEPGDAVKSGNVRPELPRAVPGRVDAGAAGTVVCGENRKLDAFPAGAWPADAAPLAASAGIARGNRHTLEGNWGSGRCAFEFAFLMLSTPVHSFPHLDPIPSPIQFRRELCLEVAGT